VIAERLDERFAQTRPERAESAQSSLGAAAARLRAAELTAEAAARVVGDQPSTVAAEMELVRARSLVPDDAAADGAGSGGGAATGALAMSAGGALLLVSVGVPVVAGAALPVAAVVALVARRRRARLVDIRSRAEAVAAAAAVERAHTAWARAVDAEREWRSRANGAAAASAELDAARSAWADLVGSDVPIEQPTSF
jgi:hypothetical protein